MAAKYSMEVGFGRKPEFIGELSRNKHQWQPGDAHNNHRVFVISREGRIIRDHHSY